jgi:predicted RecB family nuclease
MTTPDRDADPPVAVTGPDFLLDQYAAISCPVKTQNAHNPLLVLDSSQPIDADHVAHFQEDSSHRHDVIAELLARHRDHALDLRQVADSSDPGAATLAAMKRGVRFIIGAELPPDVANHRCGTADLLIRGDDGDGHRPRYHPAVIKAHSVLSPTDDDQHHQPVATVAQPMLHQAQWSNHRYRFESHSLDLLQLAHLWYLLAAAGFASEPAWAAVISTDQDKPHQGCAVVWVDLADEQIRAFSYTSARQWRKHSALSRYRHEHRFRVRVAARARQQTGADTDPPLVASPVRIPECFRCEWWPTCRTSLTDDISVRIERSPLDAREIMTLRSLGISTITDLATSDVDALLPDYLPRVAHRGGAEARLRLAARRGRLLAQGTRLERVTSDAIALPQAEVEIDLDIETSVNNRIYLWGFLVHDRRQPDSEPRYHPIHHFSALTPARELDLAEEAATWLRACIAELGDPQALVWHYSTYETTALQRLSRLSADRPKSVLHWLNRFARKHFIDLFPIVKANFFGVDGLGLKAVATAGAGFTWRDPSPSGLNSQFWFADAIHGPTAQLRQAAAARILRYNEDDVRATWALRQWLRSLGPTG